MKLTWLGHAGHRLEIEDRIILIDPWLTGCPTFPDDRRSDAIRGATDILVTHGHGDHLSEVPEIAKETGAPVHGIYDLMGWLAATHGLDTNGFNKGGTIRLGDVAITMVNASHSSTFDVDGKPMDCGDPAGYMIEGEGRTIYFSGDTDIMADMAWMAELHRPDIGILSCGGHFTMGMERAAWAARRFFDFKTVIPSHYASFPFLEGDPKPLIDGLPGVDVRVLDVMAPTEL